MSTTFFLAAQAAQQPSMMPTLIMIIALFVIMWLFMIRPQQQRQKKIREFQNSLAEGTKIITGGGVHGTVAQRIAVEPQYGCQRHRGGSGQRRGDSC